MSRRVPDLFVEQLASGDLSEARATEVRDALASEQGGLQRLAAIEASNADMLSQFPAENVIPAARLAAGWNGASRTWLSAFVAVAAVALVAIIANPVLVNPSSTSETRLKGQAPALQLHRLEGSDVVSLGPGMTANDGDRIQLSYIAAGQRFGVIVSIDGRGAVTVHEPRSTGRLAAELTAGGAHTLDQSYELDDAPLFERFFFVTSDSAFSIDQVRLAATALVESGDARTGQLDLPSHLHSESFMLNKAHR